MIITAVNEQPLTLSLSYGCQLCIGLVKDMAGMLIEYVRRFM